MAKAASAVKYPAYCPSHLAVHDSAWCTTHDHVSLADSDDPHAEALRRGFTFFHGDVENLRDSAIEPRVGDVVGDKRCTVSLGRYHLAYLREVVAVTDAHVVWKRPGKSSPTSTTSRQTWRAWARGSWRCSPENGEPTRRRRSG